MNADTYDVIADTAELMKFVQWLPALKDDERFYVTLLARSKYVEGVTGWTTNSDRKQCARFLTTADRLIENLERLETPFGTYRTKSVVVPQHALAAYITVNPRSLRAGMQAMAHRMVDWLAHGETVDLVEEALTEVHKARGSRYYVDFDFDGEDSRPEDLLAYVNREAVTVLRTRGGFHALIRPELVTPSHQKTWYMKIKGMPGVDHAGDKMIPIPGTFQGGFIPRLQLIAPPEGEVRELQNG